MIKLAEIATTPPEGAEKEDIKKKTGELQVRLQYLQRLLWIGKKQSLLVVLQGLDASGKDGTIGTCLYGVNPMGFKVKGFKAPTEEEAAHDFLWRIHPHTPERGMIQFFNRSHYEDVLFPRVHKLIDKKETERRFEHINAFEALLKSNDTIVLKFYLHMSQEKQQERFQDRKEDPLKKWKYNEGDLKESKLWPEYISAYEDIFLNCSKPIEWEVIPSDKKWYKEYLVLKSIVKALEDLKLEKVLEQE